MPEKSRSHIIIQLRTKSAMSKIGIMGGTFDPIHLAHLAMARSALCQKNLDQVWFMPSKHPPHKDSSRVSDEKLRSLLVQLAVKEEKEFVYSDYELKREEITYTAKTLTMLRKEYPEDEFFFILGEDSLAQLDQWYHPEIILSHAVILAVNRGNISLEEMERQAGTLTGKYGGTIEVIPMKRLDISSSMIRKKLAAGEDVKDMLPKSVYEYICTHQCYRAG